MIEIIVLPNEDDSEPEETFTITIISASNNVFILPDQNSVSITVSQVGMPFGEIAFFGDALELQRVSEQETLSLPLIRTQETVGATVVLFAVTGDSPDLDVSPFSSNVSFGAGQSRAELVLVILPDSLPELEETYTVTLQGATGGAAINPLAAVSMFVIRYFSCCDNDYDRCHYCVCLSSYYWTVFRSTLATGPVMPLTASLVSRLLSSLPPSPTPPSLVP